jgi:general stress protein YciG
MEEYLKKNGEKPKSKRGFGGMCPERRREIAMLGGKAAHALGKAHQYTSEEAREAGRKGGTKVAQNRQYMAEIGKRGGLKSRKSRGVNP